MDGRLDRLFTRNAYEDVEDSDYEGAESSDDDINVLLHGTVKQIKRAQRRKHRKASTSEEDEFEKEMASELNETMKNIEGSRSLSEGSAELPAGPGKDQSYYDDSYFDSDSDEEETSEEKKKKKHPIPTNDELFYDPEMDDDDQRWIDRQRRVYQPKGAGCSATGQQGGQGSNKPRPLPLSDAVLNCPGCMSLLCLDCQRHTTYSHQYRAMFVTNCTPDMTEVLQHSTSVNSKRKKTKKRKYQEMAEPGNLAPENIESEKTDGGVAVEELFHPVRCDLCRTEVAVYDKDEVYHFFNVLASY